MTITAGVDIGGSSVAAVARDEAGRIVERHETRNALVEGGHQVAASAVAAIRALDLDRCDAVGVGVPGQVDPVTGQVAMAVNLGIGTRPYRLADEIGNALGLAVAIENDVRAAALGAQETLRLAGEGPGSLTLLSIGTGIAAGVVVDGVILRGTNGMAGEIGHVAVDDSGPMCRCGQRGCLEALAAGPAIARAWPPGGEETPATALFTAAAAGDPAAIKVAERVTGYVTTALIWLAAAYDTDVIVLAGGVPSAGDPFLDMIREHIKRRGDVSELAARRLRPDQVTLAMVGDPPGPRGAAILAQRLLLTRDAPAAAKASNDT